MAAKVRLDALDDQIRDKSGAPLKERSLKEIAQDAVAEAKRALPEGLPPDSPYKTLATGEVISEAARYGFRLGTYITEDDLRLVTELLRQRSASAPQNKPREPAPPVPMQPATPLKIRGLKPSPSNTWRVECPADKPKQVSVGRGQMAMLRNGAIVNANHYSQAVLQSFVDQGVKMHPIEEPEPEE